MHLIDGSDPSTPTQTTPTQSTTQSTPTTTQTQLTTPREQIPSEELPNDFKFPAVPPIPTNHSEPDQLESPPTPNLQLNSVQQIIQQPPTVHISPKQRPQILSSQNKTTQLQNLTPENQNNSQNDANVSKEDNTMIPLKSLSSENVHSLSKGARLTPPPSTKITLPTKRRPNSDTSLSCNSEHADDSSGSYDPIRKIETSSSNSNTPRSPTSDSRDSGSFESSISTEGVHSPFHSPSPRIPEDSEIPLSPKNSSIERKLSQRGSRPTPPDKPSHRMIPSSSSGDLKYAGGSSGRKK